jgi:hypothetical protein
LRLSVGLIAAISPTDSNDWQGVFKTVASVFYRKERSVSAKGARGVAFFALFALRPLRLISCYATSSNVYNQNSQCKHTVTLAVKIITINAMLFMC